MDLVNTTLHVLEEGNIEQYNLQQCKENIKQCRELVDNRKEFCLKTQEEIKSYSENLAILNSLKSLHDVNSNALKPLLRSSNFCLNQVEEKLTSLKESEGSLQQVLDEQKSSFNKIKAIHENYKAALNRKAREISELTNQRLHTLQEEINIKQMNQTVFLTKLTSLHGDFEKKLKIMDLIKVKSDLAKQNVEHQNALEMLHKLNVLNQEHVTDLATEENAAVVEDLKIKFEECAQILSGTLEREVDSFTEHSSKVDKCLEELRNNFLEVETMNLEGLETKEDISEEDFQKLDQEHKELEQQCEQLAKESIESDSLQILRQEELEKEIESYKTKCSEMESDLLSKSNMLSQQRAEFQKEVEVMEVNLKNFEETVKNEEAKLIQILEKDVQITRECKVQEEQLVEVTKQIANLKNEFQELEMKKKETKQIFIKPLVTKENNAAPSILKKSPKKRSRSGDRSQDMSFAEFTKKMKTIQKK